MRIVLLLSLAINVGILHGLPLDLRAVANDDSGTNVRLDTRVAPHRVKVGDQCQIAFASFWNNGELVRVSADGNILTNIMSISEGSLLWTPKKSGEYWFEHFDGLEALSSVFIVEGGEVPVEISLVSAQQRYPWNGLVDIAVTFDGEEGRDYRISFAAKDLEGNQTLPVSSLVHPVSGAKGSAFVLRPGTHRFIWDANADIADDAVFNRVVMQVDVEEGTK